MASYNKKIEKQFLLGINIVLIILTIYLIKDMFTLIVCSLILSYFLKPLYEYFFKKTENERIASVLTLTSSILIIFIPIAIMSYFLILNLIKIVLQYSAYLENSEILNAQIAQIVGNFTNSSVFNNINFSTVFNSLVNFIVEISKNFFSSIPTFLLYLFIILFITYYILIYNKSILKSINQYLPLSLHKQNELLYKVGRNVKVLFKGYFLTGIIQTLVALFGYVILGAPNIFIITFLTLISSLIPYLGTPLVWVPISIYMIISGSKIAGIVLLLYGILVINLVDNFLRPYLISDKDTIPPVLVFLGFIGGMMAFGIIGIILGPLIISITTIFLKYLIQHYENN